MRDGVDPTVLVRGLIVEGGEFTIGAVNRAVTTFNANDEAHKVANGVSEKPEYVT